jgi:hypothetical protein
MTYLENLSINADRMTLVEAPLSKVTAENGDITLSTPTGQM